jgi:hypothetical protein
MMAHNGGQTNQSEKNKQRKDTRVELMGCIEQRESRRNLCLIYSDGDDREIKRVGWL